MTTCIACGMPMAKPEEHAMGDVSKNYCVHCARPDGSMQSYTEKLKSLTGFIMKTQAFDEKVARKSAKEMMAKLPAWKQ
ncbi:MAG TPA: zinc ribbon domain-containing protein [Spirochaetia bacterium]|nr:zinc ribbon domain-containing protein [Spirochaetia bacterium]